MRTTPFILLLLMLTLADASWGEEAEARYQEGLDQLGLVMKGDDSKLVASAEAFAKAALLFESAGNDAKAQESNSNLYWCKKRMNMGQINLFLEGNGKAPEIVQKLEQISKPMDASNAGSLLTLAEAFEKSNPQNHLLIAIRYFEVADRFAGTPASIDAQKRSLSAMQKVNAGASDKRDVPQIVIPAGTLLEKEYAAFRDSTTKAKALLLAALERALADETKRGNLEGSVLLKAELERLTKPEVLRSTIETKASTVTSVQKSFAYNIYTARKKFLTALDSKVKDSTKAGNLEQALKLKDERKLFLGAPKDAVELNGHCYQFYTEGRNWKDAKQFCEEQGGALACIESREEHEAIGKKYSDEWKHDWHIWIGGSNEIGVWTWVNGHSIVPFGFVPGEPSGGKNTRLTYWNWKKNVVAWDDVPGDNAFGFLCEWGISEPR